jgi:membrane-associated phospholipid phosphatase
MLAPTRPSRSLWPVRAVVRRRVAAVSCGLAVCAVTVEACAQTAPPEGLRTDVRVDLPVAAGAAALWLALELLKGDLAPASCRVCDRHPDGSDALNGPDAAVRAALRWHDPGAAAVASNVTGFVLAPVAALGMDAVAAAADGRSHEIPANVLVLAEAAALAGTLDAIVKLAVGRQRPFVHFRDDATARPEPDDNLSFYSGHTSLAFSLAVGSGTIASMRGYPLAPVVWATGLPVALLTGYLRIGADKHYFTDVLTGALLGSAVGFVVPFVFHRANAASGNAPAATALSMPAPTSHAPLLEVNVGF